MSLNLIDVVFFLVGIIIPAVVIVGLVIFFVIKLNSIDKKLSKLEKAVYDKDNKPLQ